MDSVNNDWIVPTSILLKTPTDKATIGIIPYCIKNNQIYLLLGRERIDGIKKERAGKFSDFGGGVELDGTTLIQNAIRELKEESIGQIVICEQDLLDNR
jgi:ADP-ribose pyrophosphatase YjhB (NUDIX family)